MGRHCARDTCPFCGWHHTDMVGGGVNYHTWVFRVRCCSCRALGPESRYEKSEKAARAKAEKLWNARTPVRLDRHGVEVGLTDRSVLR